MLWYKSQSLQMNGQRAGATWPSNNCMYHPALLAITYVYIHVASPWLRQKSAVSSKRCPWGATPSCAATLDQCAIHGTVGSQEIAWRPILCDAALAEHHDLITVRDGVDAVRDGQDCATNKDLANDLLHESVGVHI